MMSVLQTKPQMENKELKYFGLYFTITLKLSDGGEILGFIQIISSFLF